MTDQSVVVERQETHRRVLFVVPSVTGNQITRAYPFASLLSRRGHSVTIVGEAAQDEQLYAGSSPGLEVMKWPKPGPFGAIRLLRKLVMSHDAVCVCKPCSLGTLAALLAKLAGKRLVYDIDDDDFASWLYDLEVDRPQIGLLRTLHRIPDGVLILINFSARRLADDSMAASSLLSQKYGGKVMYVPLDPSDFAGRLAEPGTGGGRKERIVLYTGVIRGYKGLDTLVDCFPLVKRRVPDAKLVLVGSINRNSFLSKALVRKAEEMSTDIVFEGFKPMAEMPRLLSSADCLVVTSPDNPIHRVQTPVKLLHYMAAGRPIVATAIGDVPDILDQGRAGILVQPGDVEAMADAIARILESDDISKELSEQARQRFLSRYSSDAVGDLVVSTFIP